MCETGNGIISLIPEGKDEKMISLDVNGFLECKRSDELPECISELLGLFSENGDTLEKFMELKRIEKGLDF